MLGNGSEILVLMVAVVETFNLASRAMTVIWFPRTFSSSSTLQLSFARL